MSHFFKLIWEPTTQKGMINSSLGWLDVSGHHDLTGKQSFPRAEFSKMAVLLVFIWTLWAFSFSCIKDQCGFTFGQGDSLIISWKLRDKAFWSILVCSRVGQLCVYVAVSRSTKTPFLWIKSMKKLNGNVWIDRPLMLSSDVTTRKPGSDSNSLIVQTFA